MRQERTKAILTGVLFVAAVAVVIHLFTLDSGPPPLSAVGPPTYEMATTRDLSMGAVRRLEARVSLPEHYTRSEVLRIAEAVVSKIRSAQRVNAISILFYGPQAAISGPYDVAMVEWAPNGRWADAASVRAGDYSTFQYYVVYNPAVATPSSDAAALARSNDTGLLGVPLPEGARLIEQVPADPAVGRDPSERYDIEASAAEILLFFNEELPAAGWAKDGPGRATSVFFVRGNHMIGVLTNRDGGTFTLMGS